MLPDERIIHDLFAIVLQNLLELIDVMLLVSLNKVRHCRDLRVLLVRFGFLQVNKVVTFSTLEVAKGDGKGKYCQTIVTNRKGTKNFTKFEIEEERLT